MKRVEKPWGHEIWWAQTERYVGKVLHINAGQALSLQYHKVKDETIMVQSGELDFEVEVEGKMIVKKMKVGDVHHVTPLTKHRMRAVSDVEVLEVSSPEVDDVVRLEDKYGRV